MQNKLQAYLDSVKERVDAATKGPWEFNDHGPESTHATRYCISKYGFYKGEKVHSVVFWGDTRSNDQNKVWLRDKFEANLELITKSRTDVEVLLKMVKTLQSQVHYYNKYDDSPEPWKGKMIPLNTKMGLELEALIPTKEGEL